jgi:hypothetical protein
MRIHVLLLSVLVVGCAVQPVTQLPPASLCEGVTCDNHGSCVLSGATPLCVCDTGFRGDGAQCVAVPAGMECTGVDCSGNGTCFVARGEPDSPVCLCRAGFKQVGNTACVPEANPCEGVTCGGNGTCAVRGTEGVCLCNAGFSLMGTTLCVPSVGGPCEGVSCSGQGQCAVADAQARCLCNTGFVANGTSCDAAPQSPCNGITCDGHGACAVTTANQARCVCDSGYQASGTTSCVMSASNPCNGITCSGQGVCGVAQNNQPVCSCAAGFRPQGTSCVAVAGFDAGPNPCGGVTCSGQGVCGVTVSGQAVCSCNPGYRAVGQTCVAPMADGGLPQCAGITCSNQGQCVLLGNGTPLCLCNRGFYAKGGECLNEQDFACRGETCSGNGTCRLIPASQSVQLRDGGVATGPFGSCTCDTGFLPSQGPSVNVNGLACIDPCAGQTCSNHGTCLLSGAATPTCYCEPGFKPSGTLQCVPGCGTGCPAGNYCQFSNDMCRPLPATGVQFGTGGTTTELKAIAATATGEFYVAGAYSVIPSAPGNNYLQNDGVLVKYSATGVEQWRQIWGLPARYDRAQAIALDSAGNIYTAGPGDYYQPSVNMSVGKGEVIKWSPAGTRLWSFRYNLNTRATGVPQAIAVGPGPDFPIYVGGYVWGDFNGQGSSSSIRDAFILKINQTTTGAVAWTRVFGPNGDANQDEVFAMAIDTSGDVYVAGSASANVNGATTYSGGGTCNGGCAMVTCTDAFLTRFTPAGAPVWSVMLGAANKQDTALALTVSGGSVYVSGGFEKTAPRIDGFVAKVSAATGATTWLREQAATARGMGSVAVSFTGVGVDSAGTVYATGGTVVDYDGLVNRGTGSSADVVMTSWNDLGVKQPSRMWGTDDPASGEFSTGLAVTGSPARVLIVGNGGSPTQMNGFNPGLSNFTQQGTNAASFVIFGP